MPLHVNMADLDVIPDRAEWLWFCSYNTATVLMLILCIIHSYKVYQDLFTVERACFSHRKTKPELTAQYRFVQYLTLSVLYFHFGDSFFFGLEMMGADSWSHQTCRNFNHVGGWFLVIGKGCMYMLFMYRLIICYQGSAYGYSKTVLQTIGWANLMFAVIVESVTTYIMIKYWQFAQDVDEFPNPCFPINDGHHVGFFPLTMQIWDLLMNLLSLALFLYPLRRLRVIENVMESPSTHRNATSRNLVLATNYLAIKYSILTFVAFITTTIFWLFVHVAPNEYYLVAFDVVINSCCIMLMAAYYRDAVYYERLCCCFLLCCRHIVRIPDRHSERDVSSNGTSPKSEKASGLYESKTGNTVTVTIKTAPIHCLQNSGVITEMKKDDADPEINASVMITQTEFVSHIAARSPSLDSL